MGMLCMYVCMYVCHVRLASREIYYAGLVLVLDMVVLVGFGGF